DKYYRQVDPTGSGRVAAADAALFLKRSGLADLVLGKIWDLADSERKGSLNKQQFFIALRLVACAQNGLEVALKSLNVAVPPPKFHDTSSPLLAGGGGVDIPWVVKPEEKMKFDSIFDSLGPVGGMLSGEKVKPVLLNSKLPVDILGRVWELSDLDRDGMLDKDEFSVWVVSPADKTKYDELFSKTDGDMDGLVSGPEVRDIFLKTGLPSATLARIWELCDIGDIGKLTREQFALALHLINLKLTKGLDPPQSLSPEMIPPSDRQNIKQVNRMRSQVSEQQLRDKSSVEEEIKEKEEAIRERSCEVQDLQDDVAKESGELQRLQSQRQKVQEALEELDQQKGSLEEQLTHIRQQTSQETQLISSLQSEHEDQEQRICQYEEELVQAREELLALQEESRRLQEKVQAAQEQLTPLQESVRDSFTQVAQVRNSAYPFGGDPFKGSDPFAADSFFTQPSGTTFSSEDPFAASADPFGTTAGVPEPDLFAAKLNDSAAAPAAGPDPFTSKPTNPTSKDPFSSTANNVADSDPFGGKANAVGEADPFGSQDGGSDPFSCSSPSSDLAVVSRPADGKLYSIPFFKLSSSDVPPALPPKTGTPTRPPPPPPGQFLFISRVLKRHPLCACLCISSVSMAQYPTEEDMIEWAKRESEREEKERLARLTQQEQEDLELAIALSKSELS
uniref:Epidermal growth factor receptor pathway substrate 15 n=1 Tax=Amphiprion ocellaris TaxID=80972 RepID=A0AAQ5XZ05_AMPOC